MPTYAYWNILLSSIVGGGGYLPPSEQHWELPTAWQWDPGSFYIYSSFYFGLTAFLLVWRNTVVQYSAAVLYSFLLVYFTRPEEPPRRLRNPHPLGKGYWPLQCKGHIRKGKYFNKIKMRKEKELEVDIYIYMYIYIQYIYIYIYIYF